MIVYYNFISKFHCSIYYVQADIQLQLRYLQNFQNNIFFHLIFN